MSELLAHKIALDPTNEQIGYFAKACGTARFAYNWALAEWKRQATEWWERGGTGDYPSAYSLSKRLNSIKDDDFPWMREVASVVREAAIIHLGEAYAAFKAGRSRYPRKKRRDDRTAFCGCRNGRDFAVEGRRIKLPRIGWIRMREPLRFEGQLRQVTVVREGHRWFASILVKISTQSTENNGATVGVDLGIKTLATLSTGEVFRGNRQPDFQVRLRRVNKELARRQRGSKRWRKTKTRLARIHARAANTRRDTLHKITTDLTRRFSRIGIENLNVRGMVKNRCLARSISEGSFYEFRRMLEYKSKLYGSEIVVAGRFYPSSKTCSGCGAVRASLTLGERTFQCDDCGFTADRDLNAAINLERLAANSAVAARGELRSGDGREAGVKRGSVKRELGSRQAA